MTPEQLDARVKRAVDILQSNQNVEDDFTECKADWPGPEKARQLAGAGNRAAGSEIIWIVGVDDKTGKVLQTTHTDVAKWWPQMQKPFDGPTPELLCQKKVDVANGESVMALCFATNKGPYVVKRENGDKDVPMREGTRTRSATQEELHKILVSADAEMAQAKRLTWWLDRTDTSQPGRREFADGVGFFAECGDSYARVDLIINNTNEGCLYDARTQLPLGFEPNEDEPLWNWEEERPWAQIGVIPPGRIRLSIPTSCLHSGTQIIRRSGDMVLNNHLAWVEYRDEAWPRMRSTVHAY